MHFSFCKQWLASFLVLCSQYRASPLHTPQSSWDSQGTCFQRGIQHNWVLDHKWSSGHVISEDVQCSSHWPPEEISDLPNRNLVLLYSSLAFLPGTQSPQVTYLPSHFHYGRLRGGPTAHCLALLVFFQSACSLQPSETPCSKIAFAKAIRNKIQDLQNLTISWSSWNDWHFFSLKLFPPMASNAVGLPWFTPPLWSSLPSTRCWSSRLLSSSHLIQQFWEIKVKPPLCQLLTGC